MNHAYLFEGIDVQKSLEKAAKDSKAPENIVVHYHGKPWKCSDFKHVQYFGGTAIDRWGVMDGSSYPAQPEGQ
jgi:hypothetical protein